MLKQVFYGNTLEDWGISLIIIISALIINKLFKLLNKHVIQKLIAKTANNFDDILFKTLEAPFLLGIMLIAVWVAANRLDFSKDANDIISTSYKILITLNVTWFFSRFITAILDENVRKSIEKSKLENKPVENKLMPVIKRGAVIIIWLVGIVMALNNAGVSVGALLGTLGIGGIAFALAAQDTIKNIFGGITLFTDKPFRIGDRIKFDTIDGFVQDIGLRSTKILTLDKRIVTIPNYKVVDALIENVTGEVNRRVVLKLNITYDTTPEKINEAIEILKSMNHFVKDISSRDMSATFSGFGDFSLTITYIYFIKKTSPDFMESMSKVNFEILNRFNQAGIIFAYPTQTIYIDKFDVEN